MADIQILINKMLRGFWIGIIKPLMNLLSWLVEALLEGVLGFSEIALNSSFIKQAYTASLILFFLFLGIKIAYEIFSSIMEGEIVDYGKKILMAIKATVIASSLPILVIAIANPLAIDSIKAITGDNDNFSEELCVAIFTSFGDMPEYDDLFVDKRDENGNVTLGMDLGARQFVHMLLNEEEALKGIYADPHPSYSFYDEYYRTTNSFRTEQRWGLYHWWDASDNSSIFGVNSDDGDLYGDFDSGEPNLGITDNEEILQKRKSIIENNEYEMVWQFGELMVILGLIITNFLLFAISLEMSARNFWIAFCYASGPLCCLSLTSKQSGGQDPQGFSIWKQTLIGNWLTNFGQMFAFVFFLKMVNEIRKYMSLLSISEGAKAITVLVLFWGALGFVVAIPPYIKALLGGYGASAMETAQSLRGMMSAISTASGLSAAKGVLKMPEAVLGRKGVNERTDSLRRRALRGGMNTVKHPIKSVKKLKDATNRMKENTGNLKNKAGGILEQDRNATVDNRERNPLYQNMNDRNKNQAKNNDRLEKENIDNLSGKRNRKHDAHSGNSQNKRDINRLEKDPVMQNHDNDLSHRQNSSSSNNGVSSELERNPSMQNNIKAPGIQEYDINSSHAASQKGFVKDGISYDGVWKNQLERKSRTQKQLRNEKLIRKKKQRGGNNGRI